MEFGPLDDWLKVIVALLRELYRSLPVTFAQSGEQLALLQYVIISAPVLLELLTTVEPF
jgi:hypothetical protein